MSWEADNYTCSGGSYVSQASEGGIFLLESPLDQKPPTCAGRRGRGRGQRDREGGRGDDRERFYGNIESDRSNLAAIYDVEWDERPLHYSTEGGPTQSRLVVPAGSRPAGGGYAPSRAYPRISSSEAETKIDRFAANRQAGVGQAAGQAAAQAPDNQRPAQTAENTMYNIQVSRADLAKYFMVFVFVLVVMIATVHYTATISAHSTMMNTILANSCRTMREK